MTVQERRDVAKTKGYCFNCLCASHTRNWCPSRKTCMVCNNNHHTYLHVDDHKRKASTKPPTVKREPSAEPSPTCCQHHHRHHSPPTTSAAAERKRFDRFASSRDEKTRHHSHVRESAASNPTTASTRQTSQRRGSAASSATTASTRKSTVSERLSIRPRMHIFMPTALARVLTATGPENTRLILNSGAAHTIILKSLVEKLELQTTIKDGKEWCTLNLQSHHDLAAKIQITGMVRTQLNATLPAVTAEKKLEVVYNHLDDLADPHFFKPTNIEIMLGNDHICRILRAGLIQTSSTMHIAQSTLFGWTISGACHY